MDTRETFDLVSVGRRLKDEFGTEAEPLTAAMERLLGQLRQVEEAADQRQTTPQLKLLFE